MGFMDLIGFGKKKPTYEPKVMVDPSLMEKGATERGGDAQRRFGQMEEEVAAKADEYHAKLEKLESDEAQGAQIPEEDMQAAKDYAIAYGNMTIAFRNAAEHPGQEAAAAIAALEKLSSQASPLGQMKIGQLVEDLRSLT